MSPLDSTDTHMEMDRVSDIAQAGKTRPLDDSSDADADAPAEKKPRLDEDATAQQPAATGDHTNTKQTASDKPTPPPTTAATVADAAAPPTKLSKKQKRKAARGKKFKREMPEPGTTDDVVFREVEEMLGVEAVRALVDEGEEWDAPFEVRDEVLLRVEGMSAGGEAIALPVEEKDKKWAVVLPFALPGETVVGRVYRHSRLHSHADLVRVVTPNTDLRDDSRVKCRYFGTCGGCQYQMLEYDTQLEWKRTVVVNAYRRFSDLPQDSLPPILATIGSPLQYGYRTKITPHFEQTPRKLLNKPPATSEEGAEGQPSWLKIGFNEVNRRHPIDIEECPIASPVLNDALGPIRKNIVSKAYTYKKGVSLILRDSLKTTDDDDSTVKAESDAKEEEHVCVTDFKATVRERVGETLFEYQAGSFFQNNNSVLVPLTDYVRTAIFPSSPTASTTVPTAPTHLVDAYCGAGLFALTLAPHFSKVAGIELSADSIRFATRNAELNGLAEGKCEFRAGDAAHIFDAVRDFPPEGTALVIDPPRKGCDDAFIKQMLAFRAQTVVYVSCNVHTQARDVGAIVRGAEEDGRGRYVVESLRGFDLFPQTAHVESVAVLRLVR